MYPPPPATIIGRNCAHACSACQNGVYAVIVPISPFVKHPWRTQSTLIGDLASHGGPVRVKEISEVVVRLQPSGLRSG